MSTAREETHESGTRQGIQSVELAMRVIDAIDNGRGPMSLSQIAQASGMGASKAHRYLVSLCRIGILTQAQRSGLYDFGPTMRRLGTEALRRMDEVGIATERLAGLRDRTSHSVNLAVWGDTGPVVVHWEYGAHALPINVRVGATLPLLDSSVGRVFLAYLPSVVTSPVLKQQATSGLSSTALKARASELRAEVQASGIAITSGAVIAGLASLAVPIFPGHDLPLAVSVALPSRLADRPTLAIVETALRETAATITAELGGTGA